MWKCNLPTNTIPQLEAQNQVSTSNAACNSERTIAIIFISQPKKVKVLELLGY